MKPRTQVTLAYFTFMVFGVIAVAGNESDIKIAMFFLATVLLFAVGCLMDHLDQKGGR